MSNCILRNAGYVPPAILELASLRALCDALAAGAADLDPEHGSSAHDPAAAAGRGGAVPCLVGDHGAPVRPRFPQEILPRA